MPPNDPLLLLAAWVLLLYSLANAVLIPRRQGIRFRVKGKAYTLWQGIKDIAMPVGMGAIGLRFLMIGYGLLPPDGAGSRLLILLATLGVVGGAAATRIRRRPD